MFITAKGIIQTMSIQLAGFASDKAAVHVRASAARKKRAAPLNHLQHNRGAHTIHKTQQRNVWSKMELNRLEQMKTSHLMIDCAMPCQIHNSPQQCCNNAAQNSVT